MVEKLEKVLEKDKLLESILNSITDGVLVVDRSLRLIYINKIAEGFTGQKRDDVLGKQCKEVIPMLECDKNCPPKKTFHDHHPHVSNATLRTPSGNELHQLINSSPLKDDKGKIIGCVEVIKDITKRKKTEESLK